MNYEQKYKEALEKAQRLSIDGFLDAVAIGDIFPELKESKDERIKREIITALRSREEKTPTEWLDWLEKQGEQKTAVYVPKFRVGDIVKSKSRPMLDARKIISIDKDCYWCEDKGCLGFAWEDDYELVEQKPVDKVETKTLNADEVIAWMVKHYRMIPNGGYYYLPKDGIKQFKKDFKL